MRRPPREQVESMRQKRQDRRQRALRSGGAAWEVDDQGAADGAAHGTAECRERRMAQSIGAHPLSQALDDTVADQPGGIGSDIARREAGASGGNDEVCSACMVTQGLDDLVEVVRKGMGSGVVDTRFHQKASDGGTGEVLLGPLEAAVADGKDDGSSIWT